LPPTYSIIKKVVLHFATNLPHHEKTGSALGPQPTVSFLKKLVLHLAANL
jgi:hypothetical protein